jgi:uncharacterized repeat protein (TIGR01451 family)
MNKTKFITTFLIIYLIIVFPVQAFSTGNIEWGNSVSSTLYKNDAITFGNYTFKAVEFPGPVLGVKDIGGNWVPETDVDPAALLEISKDGNIINSIAISSISESYIDPNYEFRIEATEFPSRNAKEWVYQYYKPWTTLSVQLRGVPKLEVSISTDKTEYTSNIDNEIVVTTTVTNTGEAYAQSIDVNIDIGSLSLQSSDTDQLHDYYSRLEKGQSQSFSLKLLVPDLVEQKSYYFNGSVKGYDTKDLLYVGSTSEIIDVIPKQNLLSVYKTVKDNMYISETSTIRIKVVNGGIYNIYDINVKDSIDENFELINNTTLNWNIPTLAPGQYWDTSYTVKPIKTNIDGFVIPSSTAEFTANNKQYVASSSQPLIIVNGPMIKVVKSVDKENTSIGDYVNVMISVDNVGDIATKIEIQDFLPEGVSLINGSTYRSPTYLELNSPKTLNYIIRIDTDKEIEFPPAQVNYTDIRRIGAVKSTTHSNILNINKKEIIDIQENVTSKQTTPIPTIQNIQKSPSFEIMNSIIVLISIFRYLKSREKMNDIK